MVSLAVHLNTTNVINIKLHMMVLKLQTSVYDIFLQLLP